MQELDLTIQEFDLTIIGGGMSGLTLLAALQPAIEQGLSVALIDPAKQPSSEASLSPSFDDRATALAEQTLKVFKALAIEGLEQSISDICEIDVSDCGHFGLHQMQAEALGFKRFGAVIANRTLGALLWQRVKPLPIRWFFEHQVTKVTPLANGHQLRFENDAQLLTRQVVLCDGGRSNLTDQLGMTTQSKPFHTLARIATVVAKQAHQGKAFERFTPTGPVALLPFGDFSALVWTLPDSDPAMLSFSNSEALAWLNEHLGNKLGGLTRISEWQQYPLTQKTLTTNCIHGLLALGNSATTLHPVAGQGFNLAIRGIVRTAALINRTYRQRGALPDFRQFQEVSEVIRDDQLTTAELSQQLIRLFGSASPLIQLGRNLGLSSLDRHPSFSKSFALGGMGLLQSLPIDDIIPSDTRSL